MAKERWKLTDKQWKRIEPLLPQPKGGEKVGKTKRGKGTKWMVVVDGQGIPLGNYLDSASPAEVTLLEKTIEAIAVPRQGRMDGSVDN